MLNVKHIILAAILMVSVASCTKSAKLPAVSAPAHSPTSADVDFKPAEKPVDEPLRVENLPNDNPAFLHTFIKKFLDGYTVKVTYDMRYLMLPPGASLEQLDGKWVIFSIDDPADRIIRDQPLKDIRIAVRQIERAEENWKTPNCWKDQADRTWCLQNAQ